MAMEGAQSDCNSSTEGLQEHSSSPRRSQSPPPLSGIYLFSYSISFGSTLCCLFGDKFCIIMGYKDVT